MAIDLIPLVLTLVEGIVSEQQQQATQAELDTVLAAENALISQVNALTLAQNANFEELFQGVNRILVTLNALQLQNQQPVQLPPPPPGYGGPATGDVATAVWAFTDSFGNAMETYQSQAGAFADRLSFYPGVVFPSRTNPFFYARADWDSLINHIVDDVDLTLFDTRDLFTFPTLLAWLNAHKGSTYSVNPDGDPGHFVLRNLTFSPSADIEWVTSMTSSEFLALKNGGVGGSAPIWPGLANVTLGTTLVLSDGLVVTGPLDGVIITITAVPSPIGFYPFGTRKSFVHVGGIIFIDDNGEAEHSQAIGLDDQVLTPAIMTSATSAILRVKSGVTGTVTPWLVT